MIQKNSSDFFKWFSRDYFGSYFQRFIHKFFYGFPLKFLKKIALRFIFLNMSLRTPPVFPVIPSFSSGILLQISPKIISKDSIRKPSTDFFCNNYLNWFLWKFILGLFFKILNGFLFLYNIFKIFSRNSYRNSEIPSLFFPSDPYHDFS